MPPQESIQSPAKSTRSSHSSIRSSHSISSLSTSLDSGSKARAKRVRGATKSSAQPLKRTKRAVSNSSLRADIGVEADNHLSDDHASAATNDVSEVIDLDSVDDDELERDLAKAKTTWRSAIYTFFQPDVVVEKQDGRVSHFFTCAAKQCKGQTRGVRRFQDKGDKSSTANLKQHAIRCFGAEVVNAALRGEKFTPSGNIFTAFAHRGQRPVTYSLRPHTNPELRAHIAKWVAENNRPSNIVSDSELIDLLTTGRPNLKVPSPNTVRRDVKAAYAKCRERVAKLLQDHPGRLHIATDAWTSPNHRAFVAWTVHLDHEGCMLAFLLDFMEVPESHTGVALAKAFQKMLEGYGLEKKVLGVTTDNATSNDTQREALAGMDNSFREEHHVRCFNHTLQLSAKALLRPFNPALGKAADVDCNGGQDDLPDMGGEGGVDEDEDEEEEDGLIPDADDDDDDIDELDDLDAVSREQLIADTTIVRAMVSKLRQLSFSIIRSTTIALPAWRRYCKEFGLKSRILPRDVVTRWNSTFYMLTFALKYRAAIDAMTADKALKLRKFELEDEEWSVVEDLTAILLQYKNATLFFSQDSASVAAVIPAMDRLTDSLNQQTGKAYHPAITAAMKLARKKMDRYYSLTDSSNTYRIAMVLHPGMKLEYFRNQKWEDDWVEQAENLVREEYRANYEKKSTSVEPIRETSTTGFLSFGDLSVATCPRASEIQEYLSLPVEPVKDPLRWWMNNRHVYPNLHRMALDYLSIPATSTAVERVFSQGRHILPFSRNSLSPFSMQAFLCFGSWARCGLVLFGDVLAAMSRNGSSSVSEEL